jgi:hypothetical protein
MAQQTDYIPIKATTNPRLWAEISSEGWEAFGDSFTEDGIEYINIKRDVPD